MFKGEINMVLEKLKISTEEIEELKSKFKGVKALKILKIFKKIEEELNNLEEFRSRLVIKYGKEINGQIIVEKDSENFQKFVQEYLEAAKSDIDLNIDLFLSEKEIEDFSAKQLEFLQIIGVMIEGME
jgi:hypothetical protein